MTLSKEDQQDYDNHVEHLRKTVDTLMSIGNDDPDSTARDIIEVVQSRIEEYLEDEVDLDAIAQEVTADVKRQAKGIVGGGEEG